MRLAGRHLMSPSHSAAGATSGAFFLVWVEAHDCSYCTGLLLRKKRLHWQPSPTRLFRRPAWRPAQVDRHGELGVWARARSTVPLCNVTSLEARSQRYLGLSPTKTNDPSRLLAFSTGCGQERRVRLTRRPAPQHMRPETWPRGTARNRLTIYRDEEGEGILLSAGGPPTPTGDD